MLGQRRRQLQLGISSCCSSHTFCEISSSNGWWKGHAALETHEYVQNNGSLGRQQEDSEGEVGYHDCCFSDGYRVIMYFYGALACISDTVCQQETGCGCWVRFCLLNRIERGRKDLPELIAMRTSRIRAPCVDGHVLQGHFLHGAQMVDL